MSKIYDTVAKISGVYMSQEVNARPEFVGGLNPEYVTPGQLRTLFEASSELVDPTFGLSHVGIINGEEMRISRSTAEIKIDNKDMQANVASVTESGDIAFLIYEAGNNPKNTINSYLLRLIKPRRKDENPALLLDGSEFENSVNDPVDFKIAREIVAQIMAQDSRAIDNAKYRLAQEEKDRKAFWKRVRMGAGAFVLTLCADALCFI